MDNPRDDTPTRAFRRSGIFTLAAIKADDEVKGMEVKFETVHVDLLTKDRELEDLEDSQSKLLAILMYADRGLDGCVRSWDLAILDLVNKKRNDVRYQRHVPEGLRAITEAEPRTVEPSIVRKMLKTMDEDKNIPELKPLIEKFTPLFQAALVKVDAAAAALIENEDAIERLEDITIPNLKNAWTLERTALNGLLTAKFPADPARVESYFKNFARPRKSKKKDAPPPAAPPTPTDK